jgi:starch phosphorylase
MLFDDLDRLTSIATRHPFQVVMAGKAHPRDLEGREAIRRLHEVARQLQNKVTCVFLPNYDLEVAKTLIAGSDVWLNTPLPPMEASGTSGMKAALNGVLNLSVLDGWWVEACIDGVNGWSVGAEGAQEEEHAKTLYERLEGTVLPLFYKDPSRWRSMMKHAIGQIAYYFNSQRMMRRYAAEAYLR